MSVTCGLRVPGNTWPCCSWKLRPGGSNLPPKKGHLKDEKWGVSAFQPGKMA